MTPRRLLNPWRFKQKGLMLQIEAERGRTGVSVGAQLQELAHELLLSLCLGLVN